MNKKSVFVLMIFLVALSSIVTPKAESNSQTKEISFNLIKPSRIDLGEEVYVEFNRTLMADGQVYVDVDSIWFSFIYDIADVRLDPYAMDGLPQIDYWINDTSDETGRFNETRMMGAINVYIDDIDYGISSVNMYGFETNTTQSFNTIALEYGWHLITIIAAEYVSDIYHEMYTWKWSKDQVWFYFAETENEKIPEIKQAKNHCTVKATTISANLLSVPFTWDLGYIYPEVEDIPGKESQGSQTIIRSKFNAEVDVQYNITDSDIDLRKISGVAQYVNVNRMGHGIAFWWANDGILNSQSENEFQLNIGMNYVYFAAFSFLTRLDYYAEQPYRPMVGIANRVIKIENDVSAIPFNINYFLASLLLISFIYVRIKNRRK